MNTKTRGICLAVEDPDAHCNFQESTISCEASKLGRMQELHLLILDGCNVVPDDFSSWSQQLRWLQWRWNRLRSFPPQLKLPHLVVLDLSWSRELRCLWEKNVHVMVSPIDLFPADMVGESLNRNLYLSIFVVIVIILSRPSLILVVITHTPKAIAQEISVFTLISFLSSQGNLAHLVVLDLRCCGNLTCLWENDVNIQVKELFL